jgi:hypothetical protein
MPLIDLAQLESLELGAGPWIVQISEDTLNLVGCALSTLDDRDEWETDSEELDDTEWATAIEMLSLAQWELETEAVVGGEVYVDRGDPANWDTVIGNLTVDGNWHELSLAGWITDADATLVLLRCYVIANAANKRVSFRTDENVNVYNVAEVRSQVANVGLEGVCLVKVGSGRDVGYRIDTGVTTVSLLVRGWWKPAS